MASTEYSHCNNCLFFDGKNKCSRQPKEVDKKCWCGEHVTKNPLDANDIAVEYEIRRDHTIMKMQGNKVKPIEDVLKKFGWDGTERLKQGKFPEDKDETA